MYADGKSDDFVVLSTRANKTAAAVAESVEERKSPKGTVVDPPWTCRTLCRILRQSHGTAMTTGSETCFVIVDLTEEPYEVVPHVRICAGATGNGRPYRDPPAKPSPANEIPKIGLPAPEFLEFTH